MGWRYVTYRAWFEIKRKTGLLKRSFPVHGGTVHAPVLEEWRKAKASFLFSSAKEIDISHPDPLLSEHAEKIINGNIRFFNNEWVHLGKDYDWVTNPDTGYRYDVNKHWTEISDYSKESGDIKFVWEKSRFSYIYTLIRDQQHNGKDHSEFVFSEIDSWIAHNPVNRGPNYRCSQEISIRVLNWIFALYYYSANPALTAERWQRINAAISGQITHVYNNINFSRIAVRNNHAITETLALYIAGTLFPWLSSSAKWKSDGKKWFEEEVAYQIYEDGTFLQFSMNYHRVVVQLLTWAIGIAKANGESFDSRVYDRAYRSLYFLFQCQEGTDGSLPNYGANDGALFFPLNSCDYRDFRPQLNALHIVLCGSSLYNGTGAWKEDADWIRVSLGKASFTPMQKEKGYLSFDIGGYYLLRDSSSFTFIRCGKHKDRPSQADNLHLDIWVNGQNLLADSGSYKYNTQNEMLNYFMGTESHNTVMLGEHNQMLKGGRFIWYYWSQAQSAQWYEREDAYVFEGSVSCYRFLSNRIEHCRKITKYKERNEWLVEDSIRNKPGQIPLRQIWHPRSTSVRFIVPEQQEHSASLKNTWFSDRYGEKREAEEYVFETGTDRLTTQILVDTL